MLFPSLRVGGSFAQGVKRQPATSEIADDEFTSAPECCPPDPATRHVQAATFTSVPDVGAASTPTPHLQIRLAMLASAAKPNLLRSAPSAKSAA